MAQNPNTPPLFSLIFHCLKHFQSEGLKTTLTRSMDPLWHLMAQRTLLGDRYTGNIEKYYNSMFLAVNSK